jgi:hypothetical protein
MQAPQVPWQLSWQVLHVAQEAQLPLQLAPHVHAQLPSQLASGVSMHSGLGQLGYVPHPCEAGSTTVPPMASTRPCTVPRGPYAPAGEVSKDSTRSASTSKLIFRIAVPPGLSVG